jgi:tight adherence protein B
MTGILPLLIGCVALLVAGAAMLTGGRQKAREQRALNERLMLLAARNGEAARGQLIVRPERPASLPSWLRVLLARADFIPDSQRLKMMAILALAAVALLTWQLGPIVGAIALVVVLGIGPLWLTMLARRRIARLVEGLPFYFDAIRQTLMAGNSLQQALIRTSENTDFSLRRYLEPMVRRIQNGASVGDSLTWMADRLDVAELHMFAIAVQTNIHYGGRLSSVLINLTASLRDRTRVMRELRSATAETRVSSILIGSLPIVAGVLMSVLNPTYLPFFFGTPIGHTLLMVAGGLQLIGVLCIRRLMRLDF